MIYLLMGAVGLPVFAVGGLGIPFGPSGGYLVAFPVAVPCGGTLCKKRRDLIKLAIAAGASILVIYAIGVLRLSIYLNTTRSNGFLLGAVPFVPFDLLKAIFAVPVALELIL